MKLFRLVLLALAAVLASSAADVPPVAAKFLSLFDRLRNAGPHQHVDFRLSETEINDYMKYSLAATPRPGVQSVHVKLFANNYISTYTVIDFDAVERWKPGTIPALLRPVLAGKKSVWVDYQFRADDGKVTFTVEKAYYQDVRIPAFVVGKVIAILAARQPEKYDTSKPLPLPFGLHHIATSEHQVTGDHGVS